MDDLKKEGKKDAVFGLWLMVFELITFLYIGGAENESAEIIFTWNYRRRSEYGESERDICARPRPEKYLARY